MTYYHLFNQEAKAKALKAAKRQKILFWLEAGVSMFILMGIVKILGCYAIIIDCLLKGH